ncbi:hypothetical protein HDU79_011338 [Rhizoclosmatium sp. JEL0117]|nr:hypothetical protein HDU79_011338 [Rhizoclosmatium sp. JEL0117]
MNQQPALQSLLPFIGKPVSAIPANQLPQLHRVLGPKSMMTMDFNPERVNIHLSSDGKDAVIQKFTQG